MVRRAHAATAQGLAKEGVVVVDAIDLKTIESPTLAAHRKIAAARIANHAGRKRRKVLKVPTVDRQVLDRFLIDRGGNRSLRSFHDLASRRNVYHRGCAAQFQLNFERRLAADCDRHVSIIGGCETLCPAGCHPVLAGRQENDAVVAPIIGGCAFRQRGFLVRGGYRDAGYSCAIWISNPAFDVSRGGL